MKTTTPEHAGTGGTVISCTSHHNAPTLPKQTPNPCLENIKKMTVPPVPKGAKGVFIGLPARFWHRPVCARLCHRSLSFLIETLSALVWHLPAIRSRRQCAADHREAERRMGELLRETERAKGTRLDGGTKGKTGGNVVVPPAQAPTLASLGITKNESSKAQKLAALPEEDFAHQDANQLGRRNLQPQQIAVLRGNIYNRRKKKKGAQPGNANRKQLAQNEPVESTAEIVAAETGVSPATIKRDMIADAVAEIESKLRLSEAGKQGGRGNKKPLADVSKGFMEGTRAKIARRLKLSERKMKKARAIRKKSPKLAALQCPACRHLCGAPASWPSPACPMCGTPMLPFTLGASVSPTLPRHHPTIRTRQNRSTAA